MIFKYFNSKNIHIFFALNYIVTMTNKCNVKKAHVIYVITLQNICDF